MECIAKQRDRTETLGGDRAMSPEGSVPRSSEAPELIGRFPINRTLVIRHIFEHEGKVTCRSFPCQATASMVTRGGYDSVCTKRFEQSGFDQCFQFGAV